MKKAGKNKNISEQFNLMMTVDKAYSALPSNMQLAVDKISKGLSEFGPRYMGRKGVGSEFLQPRDFVQGIDERRDENARLSARAGRKIVVEKEAEIRQRFYMCVDAKEDMNYASRKDSFTKKESAEIMQLALAKYLRANDDLVELMGGGNFPDLNRKFIPHSTAIFFSDFFVTPEKLADDLHRLAGLGLNGHMVMVLDPREIDYDFDDYCYLESMDGSVEVDPGDLPENMREEYQKEIRKHIETVDAICKSKGFRFVLQRTDRPLYEGIMQMYGAPVSRQASAPAYKR